MKGAAGICQGKRQPGRKWRRDRLEDMRDLQQTAAGCSRHLDGVVAQLHAVGGGHIHFRHINLQVQRGSARRSLHLELGNPR